MALCRVTVKHIDGSIWEGELYETAYTPEMTWIAQGASGYSKIEEYTVHDENGNVLLRKMRAGHDAFGSLKFVNDR